MPDKTLLENYAMEYFNHSSLRIADQELFIEEHRPHEEREEKTFN
jgi:hypothetical protein